MRITELADSITRGVKVSNDDLSSIPTNYLYLQIHNVEKGIAISESNAKYISEKSYKKQIKKPLSIGYNDYLIFRTPGSDSYTIFRYVQDLGKNIIPSDNFIVEVSQNRPPAVCFTILKPKKAFHIDVLKLGNFKAKDLETRANPYALFQINQALSFIDKYKSKMRNPDENEGAYLFEKAFTLIKNKIEKKDGNYINLGYGGSGWLKMVHGGIPRTEIKGIENETHTLFSIKIGSNPYHLGWCKFEIKEM